MGWEAWTMLVLVAINLIISTGNIIKEALLAHENSTYPMNHDGTRDQLVAKAIGNLLFGFLWIFLILSIADVF